MSADDLLPSSTSTSADYPVISLLDGLHVALSNQQRALFQALTGVGETPAGERLGRRYLGALTALACLNNPDRLAQAGHSLREMMDLLPEAVDVRLEALREKLTNEAVKLEKAWQAARHSTCRQDGKWLGPIDKPLQKFLVAAERFYVWKAKHQPARRAESELVLIELDVSGKPPPKVLQDLNVRAWIEMHDYLVVAAHHGDSIDLNEFEKWVDALEKMILNLLVPWTFEGFDAIDAILAEGDADAE